MKRSQIQKLVPLLLASACACAHAGTITPIGILPGHPSVNSRALAINSDGTVVVGLNGITSSSYLAVRWTSVGGLEDRSCGGLTSLFSAVSATGNTAVGAFNNGSYFSSGRWDSPNPCIQPMPQPATTMSARVQGMNPTGTIVVGSADYFSTFGPYSLPFKWTQSGGVSMLPQPSGTNSGYATAVSNNSQVIVGATAAIGIFSNPQATYWDSTGAHSMGTMPSGITSVATAASSDGATIVGYGDNGGASSFSPGPIRAFRWAGGYQNLGTLFNAPVNASAYARSVTQDGSVVVGETTDPASSQTAFIWRSDFGMVELTTFLSWLGVNTTGWSRMYECNGISADSTALCGTGIYNNTTYGFVIRGLPKICGPLILASTPNDSVCAGSTAVLNVSVLTPPRSQFQWFQLFTNGPFEYSLPVSNGGNISGATTPTLVIANAQPGNAGQYYCVITGGCDTVTTPVTNLSVTSAPVVTLNPPLSVAPCGQGPQSLSIAATSNAGPISYQWQAEVPFMSNNFVNLTTGLNVNIATASGVNTPTLTLTNFYLSGATAYRCRLTNSCGTSYPLATLVTPCFGDFNCDGSVDFFDYLDFVDSYSASTDTADFNHDGNIDFFDYLDFVDSYSAGC